jgi:hypothetical protein
MKKLLLIIVAAAMFMLPGAAYADTVNISTQANYTSPAGGVATSPDFVYAFGGPQTITFTVAGKTCNLIGSGRGSVPTGCNYAVTIAPNGSITGKLAAGNSVCTQSANVAASCK